MPGLCGAIVIIPALEIIYPDTGIPARLIFVFVVGQDFIICTNGSFWAYIKSIKLNLNSFLVILPGNTQKMAQGTALIIMTLSAGTSAAFIKKRFASVRAALIM